MCERSAFDLDTYGYIPGVKKAIHSNLIVMDRR